MPFTAYKTRAPSLYDIPLIDATAALAQAVIQHHHAHAIAA